MSRVEYFNYPTHTTSPISKIPHTYKPGKRTHDEEEALVQKLMDACHKGDISLVESLLEVQVLVNVTTSTSKLTALHIAVQKGHAEIVTKLLKAKANPNIADKIGITPLMEACLIGSLEMVEDLIRAGADATITDKEKSSTIMFAMVAGKESILNALLKAGADFSTSDITENTPLHWAVKKGDLKMVTFIVKHFEEINNVKAIEIEGKGGLTPLNLADSLGHKDIVDFLIDHDAEMASPTHAEIATLTYNTQQAFRIIDNESSSFTPLISNEESSPFANHNSARSPTLNTYYTVKVSGDCLLDTSNDVLDEL